MNDFLFSKFESDGTDVHDNDSGEQDAPGDDDQDGVDDDQADQIEARVEGEDHDGEEPDPDGESGEPDARQERISRVVQKLTKSERKVAQLEKELHELKGKSNPPRKGRQYQSTGRFEFARDSIAESLGVDPSDPRVTEELRELTHDLVLDLSDPDVINADPRLKEQREKRRVEAEQNTRHKALQDSIDNINRENAEAIARANHSGAMNAIGQYVHGNADKFPYLLAQGQDDPVGVVLEVLQAELAQGLRLKDDRHAANVLENISFRLDNYYKQQAEKFAKIQGRKSEETRSVGKQSSDTPRKQKKKGYTTTNSGASKAAAKRPVETQEKEDFNDFFDRKERERRQANGR